MPELPEVETMRRGVLAAVGAKIQRCERPACKLKPILFEPGFEVFRRRVTGRTIADVSRRGKRVLLNLDDDSVVVIEPRMTGLVLLANPPGPAHLRLRLLLQPVGDAGTCPPELLFWDRRGLGTVRWLDAADARRWMADGCLGPDALVIDCDALRSRLGKSRRAVKVALLDQRVLAGVGNLYASEILHRAGVDPRTPCDALSRAQWVRIHGAMRAVLLAAIEHEGSTLSDGTYRNALNEPGGYQNHHRVYDRAGAPCTRCSDGAVRRIVQAQRSTFFCPSCQRRRGRHPLVEEGI